MLGGLVHAACAWLCCVVLSLLNQGLQMIAEENALLLRCTGNFGWCGGCCVDVCAVLFRCEIGTADDRKGERAAAEVRVLLVCV
jgi:hypothetical protein